MEDLPRGQQHKAARRLAGEVYVRIVARGSSAPGIRQHRLALVVEDGRVEGLQAVMSVTSRIRRRLYIILRRVLRTTI